MSIKPIIVRQKSTQILDQISLDDGGLTEIELQYICYENPHILPIVDIEPIYADAVPICVELRVPSGFCDILYINPNGLITLVETKLWRNPESQRKVISQILDYAKDLVDLSFEEFERSCIDARKGKDKSLFQIVSAEHPDINESSFIDQVSKNLKLGRFLLLVVGDGIRENAKGITKFMNQFANMSFTLALIEMPFYKINNDEKIIMPRVNLSTTQIEREVFITKEGTLQINNKKTESIAKTASESEFYKRLSNSIGSDSADELKVFADSLVEDLDMNIVLGRGKKITISLKDSSSSYNFAGIWEDNNVIFYGLGNKEFGEDYLDKLAGLLSAKVDKNLKTGRWTIKKQGKPLSIKSYLGIKEEWKNLLSVTLAKIAETEY